MNLPKLRRISISLLLITVLLPPALHPLPSPTLASSEPSIWGTKPVLEYFLLTAGLSDQLKDELSLTDIEFRAVQQIALREAGELNGLRQESQPVVEDLRLSLRQKRDWVVKNGYNLKVEAILDSSQQSLRDELGEGTYTRLVDWIDARWEVERQVHGIQAAAAGARTFKIYATRYDSNGAYTVAIPDKCIKLANGGAQKCSGYEYGQNYSVKLQYGDNPPVKVTVGESGPWNVDDNFWATVGDPQPRRLFTDLPLGMPEAQAAYMDNYNDGLDQFGRKVTSPVAIDLAREVSVDIGLQPGLNDWIDVTYLWTEGWESQDVQEVTVNTPTKLQPVYFNDMCGSSWHKITGFNSSPAYLTLNVTNQASSTNSAEWVPDLPVDGDYRVEAFIPDHAPIDWQCPELHIPRDTSEARYTITHADGSSSVSGDQGPLANQWLELGTFPFKTGTGGSVKLSDVTGEEELTHSVSFSAVRFVLLNPPAPSPDPSPSPEPTPTPPVPDPTIQSGSAISPPGGSFTVPIQVLYLRGLSVGAATIDIRYNPGVLKPTTCQADPSGSFSTSACDLTLDQDGINPDAFRISLSSPNGSPDPALLAQVTFEAVGDPSTFSPLDVAPVVFTDPNSAPLAFRKSGGLVCIAPCQNLWYLPFMPRLFSALP